MTRIYANDVIGKTVDAFCLSDENCVIGFSDGTFLLLSAQTDGESVDITDQDFFYSRSLTVADILSAREARDGGFISEAIYREWKKREDEKTAAAREEEVTRLRQRLNELERAQAIEKGAIT